MIAAKLWRYCGMGRFIFELPQLEVVEEVGASEAEEEEDGRHGRLLEVVG
jgi:hypothetical protein